MSEDIPIMLAGQVPQRGAGPEDLGVIQYLPTSLKGVAERARRFIRPSLVHRSKHRRSLTERFVDSLPPDASVLNVGAGASDYGMHVVNLDIAPGQGIHVVGVAEHLPFQNGVFEGIVFQAVLEHVTDSRQALSEIRRVLRPGGTVFVEVPFIQGYHAAPRDHRRYTEQGLRAELEQQGFTVEETGVAVGPASGMAWVTAEFLALLVSGRSTRAYRFARLASTWLAWPIEWADAWLDGHEMAHVIASGVWAQARKPQDP
ncbi:MAG: class I SAM-dependent methyltransferase [Actinomycetota bacterium]|nr:class I SAM-dependent methyltransferase [Actinomycetota bacterium]